MKNVYIKDILEKDKINSVDLFCWIKNIRNLGGIIFLDLLDSTGDIGAFIKKDSSSLEVFKKIVGLSIESSVRVSGIIQKNKNSKKEIEIKDCEIIGKALLNIEPSPRKDFNIFDKKYVDFILSKQHLFIRNQKIANVIKIKSALLESFRQWFKIQGFIEIDTPILTQSNLYEDDATFEIDYFKTKTYLSQCASLYLNSAISAFEKVFTITPAFRKQPSKSPRHNPEFWHVKAQAAFYSLDDMIAFTEEMILNVFTFIKDKAQKELSYFDINLDIENLKPPYPQISYDEALKILKKEGIKIKWGKSLNEKAEKVLSDKFKKPVFIKKMPKTIEPFPYVVDELNPDLTMTADLLADNGYGEILGLAEFIYNPEKLISRMKDTNKYTQLERFKWYLELKQFGDVPASGFGLGIERFLRWMLKLPHVRNAFLFPRLYHRKPYP